MIFFTRSYAKLIFTVVLISQMRKLRPHWALGLGLSDLAPLFCPHSLERFLWPLRISSGMELGPRRELFEIHRS